MIKRFIFLSLLLSLSACSLFSPKTADTLTVYWEAPQKIYFQGKGAGAGMALMSTMGPMGMAIGVAIDEGIAKDIAKAQQETNKTVQQLFNEQASGQNITWHQDEESQSDLRIKRLEFRIVPGGDDLTAVEIEVVDQRSAEAVTIKYPNDFSELKASSYPLADLKKDGSKTNLLIEEAFMQIIKRVAK